VREERRLRAADHQRAVPVELFARGREAELELGGVAHVEPQELRVGRPLQEHELEVVVVRDRASHELHLPARLALEVEDLLPVPPHVDPHLARVVPVDALPLLRRNAEADALRSRVTELEADARHDRLAVRPELDVLLHEDPALVLHDERHDRSATEAVLRHDDVDHQRRACQHVARQLHAAELDVGRDPLVAEPDGEDRNVGGLERHDRLGERALTGVRPVGDQHETGERHARELTACGVQRAREIRVRAVEPQLLEAVDPARRVREAEEAQHEPLRERLEQLALTGRERLRHEVASYRPSESCRRMLRESSISMPTKFCWGTTVESVSVGCMRQNTRIRDQRHPQAGHDTAVHHRALAARDRVGGDRARREEPAMPRKVRVEAGAPNANSPCSKTRGRYLKRNSKMLSMIARSSASGSSRRRPCSRRSRTRTWRCRGGSPGSRPTPRRHRDPC
jgi:hypothetical protein